MEKYCDNKSVGVVVSNEHGQLALLERRRFPSGIAPPAGHIDHHGDPERAAMEEVEEEIGVSVALNGLIRTQIANRRIDNVCRRIGGDHHDWTVYEAHVKNAQLLPSADETRGASWYEQGQISALATRTRLFQAGLVSPDDWDDKPGIEPVWLDFLTELGYIQQ